MRDALRQSRRSCRMARIIGRPVTGAGLCQVRSWPVETIDASYPQSVGIQDLTATKRTATLYAAAHLDEEFELNDVVLVGEYQDRLWIRRNYGGCLSSPCPSPSSSPSPRSPRPSRSPNPDPSYGPGDDVEGCPCEDLFGLDLAFALAGVADGDCTTCDEDYNDTFHLESMFDRWETTDQVAHCAAFGCGGDGNGDGARFALYCTGASEGAYVLVAVSLDSTGPGHPCFSVVRWGGGIDCDGYGILYLIEPISNGLCIHWPATVLITPA